METRGEQFDFCMDWSLINDNWRAGLKAKLRDLKRTYNIKVLNDSSISSNKLNPEYENSKSLDHKVEL